MSAATVLADLTRQRSDPSGVLRLGAAVVHELSTRDEAAPPVGPLLRGLVHANRVERVAQEGPHEPREGPGDDGVPGGGGGGRH